MFWALHSFNSTSVILGQWKGGNEGLWAEKPYFFLIGFYIILIISLILRRVNIQVGQKLENPEKKHLSTCKQAELGLSHLWPERGSNPQQWDDGRLRALNHSVTRAAQEALLRFGKNQWPFDPKLEALSLGQKTYEPLHEKTCLMRTTKVQTSLPICAVWSAPLLFAA